MTQLMYQPPIEPYRNLLDEGELSEWLEEKGINSLEKPELTGDSLLYVFPDSIRIEHYTSNQRRINIVRVNGPELIRYGNESMPVSAQSITYFAIGRKTRTPEFVSHNNQRGRVFQLLLGNSYPLVTQESLELFTRRRN